MHRLTQYTVNITRVKTDKPRGFTLVEVVVAMSLMAVSIGLLVALVSGMQNTQRATIYTDEATRIARSKIADLKTSDYASLVPGDTTTFSVDESSRLPRGAEGTVEVSAPTLPKESKQVDVTIQYMVGSTLKKVTLTEYIKAH